MVCYDEDGAGTDKGASAVRGRAVAIPGEWECAVYDGGGENTLGGGTTEGSAPAALLAAPRPVSGMLRRLALLFVEAADSWNGQPSKRL